MVKRKINWLELILGILFVVAGFMSFLNPGLSLDWLITFIAIIMLINGVVNIYTYFKVRNFGISSYHFILVAILDFVVAYLFFTKQGVAAISLSYIFAIWFLVGSITGLTNARLAKNISNGYYIFTLICNIVGVLLGIYLLFDPLTSAFSLGMVVSIYFLLFGILNIYWGIKGRWEIRY